MTGEITSIYATISFETATVEPAFCFSLHVTTQGFIFMGKEFRLWPRLTARAIHAIPFSEIYTALYF